VRKIPFSVREIVLSVMELVPSVREVPFSLAEIVLSVTEKVLSIAEIPFFMAELVLSVRELVLSVMEIPFYATELVPSFRENGFSASIVAALYERRFRRSQAARYRPNKLAWAMLKCFSRTQRVHRVMRRRV
jgi:hypothetical protein